MLKKTKVHHLKQITLVNLATLLPHSKSIKLDKLVIMSALFSKIEQVTNRATYLVVLYHLKIKLKQIRLLNIIKLTII